LFKKFNLPTELPEGVKISDLVGLINKDKKRLGNKISFIIVPEMGEYEIIELETEKIVSLLAS
jgi:3-dehydroquinate synthetase